MKTETGFWEWWRLERFD